MSSRLMPRSRQPTLSPAMPCIERLVEHFDAGHDRLAGLRAQADDLDFVADLDDAALDTAGGDRAAALDREHVFDGHQERLVLFAHRLGNVGVERVHQVVDALAGRRILAGCRRPASTAPRMIGISSPGKSYLRQQLADFHLDQFEQFGIVDRVDLVQEHDERGTPTWRASRMCSRVCGIGPSAAETTRMAPSIWAAPVIMFLM